MSPSDIGRRISLGLAIAYGVGFIAWNFFLVRFGFFEYNLLQTRFLSAGALFLLPFVIGWYLIKKVSLALLLIYKKCLADRWVPLVKLGVKFILGVSLVVYYYLFVSKIFPKTDQYIGGAKPFPILIIFEPGKVNFYKDLGFEFYPSGQGQPEKLSRPVCNLYQNNDFVILGIVNPIKIEELETTISTRIVILKREEAVSFSPVPAQNAQRDYGEKCRPFIELGWYY